MGTFLRRSIFCLAALLLLGATEAFACGCVGMPGQTVQEYVIERFNSSTAVFSGKAIGFEWRKEKRPQRDFPAHIDMGDPDDWETKVVRFKVDRWWRLAADAEIVLYTDEKRNTKTNMGSGSSCDYSFEKGESYVVFAHGPENRLSTHSCAGNQPIGRAGEYLKFLGKGEEPRKPTDN